MVDLLLTALVRRGYLIQFETPILALHEVPHDLSPIYVRRILVPERDLVVIVPGAVDELGAPETSGPYEAGPPVDPVHVRGVGAVVGAAQLQRPLLIRARLLLDVGVPRRYY